MMQPVITLKEGDLIDMDAIFNHLRDIGAPVDVDDIGLASFEYGRVDSVEIETSDCVALHFVNYGSYGVPPTLMVEVVETA